MFSEQLYLVYVGGIVLLTVLFALIDWKWGRGIAFTALALLAGAVSVYLTAVTLQTVQKTLEREVAGLPQSWNSFGVGLSIIIWYIYEIPILLGLGIGAVLLAALSRRRGWIIATALALLFTVVAPFLAYVISDTINADIDIVNPRSVQERDVRLVQVHLPFVGVLLAIQLLYLAYGVWRIWRSSRLGSQPTVTAPLPSAQS